MAGYGYSSRGYTGYQGMEPRTDDWNKSSYAGNGHSDHVCRPVIVDMEGRKRPIISYNPSGTERYVTERIVEHVHTPAVVTDYKYGSPTRVETFKDYGVANNRWGRSPSPVHDRPQQVEDFITKIQTEVSRPTRTGLVGSTNWRSSPAPTGYDEYSSHSSDWNKPSVYTFHDTSLAEPHLTEKYGYEREEPKGWSTAHTKDTTPLSNPTTDIGTAMDILREAAAKSSPATAAPTRARYTLPASATPPRGTYVETIDSREAGRRYGNFKFGSRPLRTEETYSGTLNSVEAAQKYKGARV